jgi:chromosome segregation ATPase
MTYQQVIKQQERQVAKLQRENDALRLQLGGAVATERTALDRMHASLVRQQASLAIDAATAQQQSAEMLAERFRRERDLHKLKLELSAEMEDELRFFHVRRRALTKEFNEHRAKLRDDLAAFTEAMQRKMARLDQEMQALYAQRWQRRTAAALSRVARDEQPAFCPDMVRPGEVIASATTLTPVIYALITLQEPHRVRYVGQARRPFDRWITHTSSRPDVPQVGEWITSARSRGDTPAMLCLERCELEALDHREAYWIHHFLALGMADLNISIPSFYKVQI